LREKREAELGLGTSLSGPHRDRYAFVRDGSDFAAKASTGQRRLLALLLRATQALRYRQTTGRKPLLLLVMFYWSSIRKKGGVSYRFFRSTSRRSSPSCRKNPTSAIVKRAPWCIP
jgi:hypothetical protein